MCFNIFSYLLKKRTYHFKRIILLQVSASGESQYDDAFTIQMVEDEHVHEFNYVAGCVPFLLNLIKDVCKLKSIFDEYFCCQSLCINWILSWKFEL